MLLYLNYLWKAEKREQLTASVQQHKSLIIIKWTLSKPSLQWFNRNFSIGTSEISISNSICHCADWICHPLPLCFHTLVCNPPAHWKVNEWVYYHLFTPVWNEEVQEMLGSQHDHPMLITLKNSDMGWLHAVILIGRGGWATNHLSMPTWCFVRRQKWYGVVAAPPFFC